MPLSDLNRTESDDSSAVQVIDPGSGNAVDPRQIRSLTTSDVVKAQLQDNNGNAVTNGQKTMANSIPVVVSSDQSNIEINLNDAAGTSVTVGQKTMASSLPIVPASDFIERPTFTAYATAIAPAANKSMISLQNASGSGVVIKIREILVFNQQTAAVTGTILDFRVHKFATHSAGTLITADAHDSNDSLNVNVTVRTGATIVTEAARFLRRWLWSSDEFGSGTADAETTEHTTAQLWPIDVSRYCKPYVVRPGEGIHIKQTVSSTAGAFDLVLVFTQEAS